MSLLPALLILLTSSFSLAWGQGLERQRPWLGNPSLDVESYQLGLVVPAMDAPVLPARLAIRFKLLSGGDVVQLHFDQRRLQVKTATVNGAASEFRVVRGSPNRHGLSGDVLTITPPSRLGTGRSHQLVLEYEMAVSRETPEQGMVAHRNFHGTALLSTRSWPYYTRMWMPSHDHPSDVATFSVQAEVPRDYAVLANGEMLDASTATNRRGEPVARFAWSLDVPIPTYGMSVVIGRFREHRRDVCFSRGAPSDALVRCSSSTHGIPAVFYLPPNHPEARTYLSSFEKSNRALAWFSGLLGLYQYPKSAFVVAPHPFSMEHPSLVTLVEPGAGVHEVAHHWWGNTVHIAHWGDLWISEGFTTYMDGLYNEHSLGTDTSCRQTTGRLNAPADTDPMDIFDDTPYCKGAAALNGLRETIARLVGVAPRGPEARQLIYEVLRSVYQAYRFRQLSTQALVTHLQRELPGIVAARYQVDAGTVRASVGTWAGTWLSR